MTDPSSSSLKSQLRDTMEGFERSQLIYLAAKLGLPDLLDDGAQSVETLSGQTGVAAPVLYRLMRGLAWCSLVRHLEDDSFELTPLGELLRVEAKDTLYERALCIGEVEYPAWGALLQSLQDPTPAFDRVFGMKFYDYLQKNAEIGANFDRMMGKGALPVARSVVQAYNFSDFTTVVDVGGSDGTLMSTILRANPDLRGVIFDLPSVIERTGARIGQFSSRVQLMGGDFFDKVPAGGDAYIMKWILHNWPDEHCVRLLTNCRRAMSRTSRLLILEQVMPERVGPDDEVVGWDLGMLVHLGSSERTEAEFRTIFERAGFSLLRVIPTSSGMSIIEGEPGP